MCEEEQEETEVCRILCERPNVIEDRQYINLGDDSCTNKIDSIG